MKALDTRLKPARKSIDGGGTRQNHGANMGLRLVATPNSAHTAVIALDGDGPAIAAWRRVDTSAARSNTDPNAGSGYYDPHSGLGSTSGRTAIIEVILLANTGRPLDVPAAGPAGPAAHCNGGD
jgi:hypothetical protein